MAQNCRSQACSSRMCGSLWLSPSQQQGCGVVASNQQESDRSTAVALGASSSSEKVRELHAGSGAGGGLPVLQLGLAQTHALRGSGSEGDVPQADQ